uniref:Sulfide dehydrogenase (Flavocytochrome c), cytochrome c subunit n=1 Tax=Candidatus Kentrum sp. MB TaxID=2138164 RepID=A0A451BBA0_9GAMM|nr:MAG: sulfide dehydrogenase (flavocytochrome c), cytochrome c subunit [Candidatus Kentron sp. MB]VFK31507.1 MAG: sulfide dehydrogenase (flavocytochrome c), cytochrome c subunit [Candidatus Kentron sp. MB]VFK75542.1 MAG: sulfide dehydrogenase (flavocytochrome c), cytochrome c subunit [Candidatus Kentron sp. MB]
MKQKTIRNLLLVGSLAGSLACGASAFAGGPSPDMLSQPCAGCHGTNGVSMGPAMPTIAGLSEDYFQESMEEFKNGERASTIMGRVAKGYSEEEIEAMAAWFAEKPFVRAAQKSDAEKAAKGEKLHRKYCEKCHEEGGALDDETGILAGQWMPYLRYSLHDYLTGTSEAPKKMKKRLDALEKKHGKDGIEAIVQYYGSQQ